MDGQSKRIEIIITVLGLIITAILGYGQWNLGQQQNMILSNQNAATEKRSIDTIEVQVMSLVSPHLKLLGLNSPEAERSERIVLVAAEYLTNNFGRTSLAEMAAKISGESETVNIYVQTRLEEARQVPPKIRSYFTVLASFPTDDLITVRDDARKLLSHASLIGLNHNISIYRTKISNNYAVVIGGQLDEASARSLAAKARTSGLAKDSFHQINKEWQFVENVTIE